MSHPRLQHSGALTVLLSFTVVIYSDGVEGAILMMMLVAMVGNGLRTDEVIECSRGA